MKRAYHISRMIGLFRFDEDFTCYKNWHSPSGCAYISGRRGQDYNWQRLIRKPNPDPAQDRTTLCPTKTSPFVIHELKSWFANGAPVRFNASLLTYVDLYRDPPPSPRTVLHLRVRISTGPSFPLLNSISDLCGVATRYKTRQGLYDSVCACLALDNSSLGAATDTKLRWRWDQLYNGPSMANYKSKWRKITCAGSNQTTSRIQIL